MLKDESKYEEERTIFADESIFELFSWQFISGDPETALTAPYSVVISESMARKYFDDEDPLGQVLVSEEEERGDSGQIKFQQKQFRVTGVIQDIPFKSHLRPDFIFSFITLNDYFEADVHGGTHPNNWYWRGRMVHNYVLLEEKVAPSQLESKLPGFLEKYVGDATTTRGYVYHPYLQPVAGIHLEGNVSPTFEDGGDSQQLYLFSIIAGFILLIACINFMNLSTSRSLERAKEVGIRKVVGANRGRLIYQFIGESVLMSGIAMFLALFLVELLNPTFYSYIGYQYYFDDQDLPLFLSAALFITIIVGLVSGSYPAFVLSNFQPVRVLKGRFRSLGKGASLRKILVVFQFAITVFFIVGTLTVYNQLRFMRTRDLGFKSSQVLVIPREVAQYAIPQIEAVRNELIAASSILKVTVSSGVPGRYLGGDVWVEKGKSAGEGFGVSEFATDYDFIDFYGLNLVAGRNFKLEMATDAAQANIDSNGYEIAAIINEAAVREFGWLNPEDALGRRLVRDPASNDFTGRVIGVIQDFHYESLHNEIAPMILFINSNYATTFRHISVKIASQDIAGTIDLLRQKFTQISAQTPFDYFFLNENFGQQYEQDEKMMEVYGYVSGLAIFIACLGLFGLSSFAAERRRKEVGVRKVLGANIPHIISLMSSEFLKLVLVANVVALPIAYFVMTNWLENYAYRFNLGLGTLMAASVITLLIAMYTLSSQAIKAALANPVEALRYE